jgi:probable phosphoglycerate mutase
LSEGGTASVSAGSDQPRVYRQHRFTLPAGAADILLIRHGESMPGQLGVPFPTWQGHADPPLAPQGEVQALALARRLVAAEIDAVYVTPLQRTQQTIAPLAAERGLTPAVEADLIEVHLGDWEGVTFRQKTEEHDPVAVRVFVEQRWDVIPGAEPTADFERRVRRGLLRIAAAHPDQHVAVVVHGGVIGQLLALATGSQRFAFVGADNASISQLVVQPDRWTLRRFNDTTHLDPALTLSAAPPQ